MKTQSLIVKRIDGFDVITGFQDRPVNPVETQRDSRKNIQNMPETLALKAKNEIQNGYRVKLIEARKNAKAYLYLAVQDKKNGLSDTTNKSESAKQSKIANDLTGMMNTVNEEMKVLSIECKTACEKVLIDNPVYFEERAGEVIKNQTDIDKLLLEFNGKPDNTLLLVSGDLVTDLRGKIFYKKVNGIWEVNQILSLSVKNKPVEKLLEDLTEEERLEIKTQEETKRISNLSNEEKIIEFEFEKDNLMDASIKLRLRMEIEGETVDYAKSQAIDFYNQGLEDLKIDYGVI